MYGGAAAQLSWSRKDRGPAGSFFYRGTDEVLRCSAAASVAAAAATTVSKVLASAQAFRL